ncbi:hypothetical protein KIL84_009494 [Mauremys mutica]|uniref:DUF3456 domain-containing protein n=1 Tax=Mauremys mutica TaxID=74926 RepID=A0A9D4ANU1_9SAUR|nr:hypothetical protein KIL84_009494 [Mauremys mutica]
MWLPLLGLLLLGAPGQGAGQEEEDERRPTPCEVCKYLSLELQETLAQSGRSKEVLELGQCETMLEQFEAVLEDWYFHHQETALGAFLCEGHVLAPGERGCLSEVWTGRKGDEGAQEEEETEEETMEQPSPPTRHAAHDPREL